MNDWLKSNRALVKPASDDAPYGDPAPTPAVISAGRDETQACREDGCRACGDGWKKKDNPYEPHGWQWVAWNEGWESTFKERRPVEGR